MMYSESALIFQHTKKMLVLKGKDVPVEKANEDPAQVFIDTVARAFSVHLSSGPDKEWAACHRLGNRLIVSFIRYTG